MNKIVLLIAALFLWACSTDSDDEVSAPDDTIGAEIAEDYNNALEKARGVEDQVMDQKEKLDEALEDPE